MWLVILIGAFSLWLVCVAVFMWTWKVLHDVNARMDELSEQEAEEMTRPRGNVHVLEDYRHRVEL